MRALAVATLLLGVWPARAVSPDDIRINARLDRERVYVHEQVVLTIEIVHPAEAQATWQPPVIEDFWAERLPSRARGVAGAEGWRVSEFRRALFPTASGTARVPPSTLLLRGTGPDTELRVPGAELRVERLPPAPDGASGSPVVGALEVRTSLVEDTVVLGRSVGFTLELLGDANLWDAPLPDLQQEIEGVEVFAESPRLIIGERSGRASTRRSLRFDLVPADTGRIRIPAVAVPYYDTAAARWAVARSTPLALLVTRERVAKRAPWERQREASAASANAAGPGLLPPGSPPIPWPWLAAILAATLVGLLLWLRRWSRLQRGRDLHAGPSPAHAFDEARAALGTPRFPGQLARAVKAGIRERHGIDVLPLTTAEIAARVEDADALALLRTLDAQRFGQGRDENAEASLGAVRSYLGL